MNPNFISVQFGTVFSNPKFGSSDPNRTDLLPWLSSYGTKRKAEFDPEEEEEESDGEREEGKAKIEEREGGGIDYLKVLEWDVDSFDGLEDYSSPEVLFSSDEEPFSEEVVQHYCLFKRQMIESKGFYGDPALKPFDHYIGIKPMGLQRYKTETISSQYALTDKDFRAYWEDMVYVCLQKLNQDKESNVELVEIVRGYYRAGPRSKSYITFMAREKPDGPLVEYQAKCMNRRSIVRRRRCRCRRRDIVKRRVNDKEEKCKWAADGLRAQMKNVFCVVGLQKTMLRLKKAEMAALMNSTIHLELSSDEQPLSDGEEALENSHIVKFKNQGYTKLSKRLQEEAQEKTKSAKNMNCVSQVSDRMILKTALQGLSNKDCFVSPSMASMASGKVERGHQLYRDGKYKEALLFYTEALTAAKAKPQKIALHSNRAACYLKLHDFIKVSFT
ncbi:unnamed protein product [Arabidopsis thaliana]|uniref:Tetratricopeptide repeat (TPR)-like superfamily protein n=1 Tax=Arabidopsis thaliana TaxID=3702 RepID=A0A654FLN1_ARATH|nr:unnamed protein product [Arabidopsis thaliana]